MATVVTTSVVPNQDRFGPVVFEEEVKKALKRKRAELTDIPVVSKIEISPPEIWVRIAKGGSLNWGAAICGPKDKWNPEIGIRIAIHRAVADLIAE